MGPLTLPTTTELLLAWDALRPRSQQTEVGMSQLGGCRRQTGYMLAGCPPDEGWEPNKIQAVLGTAIHLVAAQAATELLPSARAEDLEVWFGGMPGHPDLLAGGVVRDLKTKGYTLQLEMIRQSGPPQYDRFQVHTYAGALNAAGHQVDTVQLDYLARDSGEEYIWEEPFDVAVVEAAMSWLADVRSSEIEMLPRDYRPSSAFCQGCEFFRRCWDAEPGKDPLSVLYRDDPDAAAWMDRLTDAQARRKQAEADEEAARGALDALRTVSQPGEKEYIEVPGADKVIRFHVKRGRTSFDKPRIAVDYRNAGARPPTVTADPVITVALVKAPQ